MMNRLVFILMLFFVGLFADYNHQLQFNVTLAKSYNMTGESMVIPLSGTQNVLIQIYEDGVNQVIWKKEESIFIDHGEIAVSISD